MENFFEVLGVANIERIHSQMWLYFFQENFLSDKQKSDILNNLFGATGEYKSFKCYTEYKNIDVLIRADDVVFAIENKIKIGQHDNQLETYYKILINDFKVTPYCLYLSLIGENSHDENWKSKSYKDLLNVLSRIDLKNPKNFQEQIFNEYVDSLRRLVGIFEEFSKNHHKFWQVFLDGSKTKDEKRELLEGDYYENDDQKYVAFNNLETIFQKFFLLTIAKGLNLNLDSDKLPKAHIDESRGNALLHIDIRKGDDKDFLWGIQFQSETVKITYSKKDYTHSLKAGLGIQNIEKLKKLGKEHGLRFNPPKTKAYMSLSKPFSNFSDKDLWKKDFDFLLKLYKKEYESIKKLIGEISL